MYRYLGHVAPPPWLSKSMAQEKLAERGTLFPSSQRKASSWAAPAQGSFGSVTDRRTGKTVVRYQVTVDRGMSPATGRRRQQALRRYSTSGVFTRSVLMATPALQIVIPDSMTASVGVGAILLAAADRAVVQRCGPIRWADPALHIGPEGTSEDADRSLGAPSFRGQALLCRAFSVREV